MNFFLKIFKFLPPEFAHSASLNSLNLLYKSKLLVLFNKKIINKNEHTIFGMKLRNKLGTAAGLDKNGDYIDALGALGFGFLKSSLSILFSTEVIKFRRFSFTWKSLKSGVLGEDIFIVM